MAQVVNMHIILYQALNKWTTLSQQTKKLF